MKLYSKKTSVSAALDTRKPNTKGKYPVCIRLIFNRKITYRSIGSNLTKEEYDQLYQNRHRPEYAPIFTALEKILLKASSVIEDLSDNFTIPAFDSLMRDQLGKNSRQIVSTLDEAARHKAKDYHSKNQNAMIDAISQSTTSLKSFCRKLRPKLLSNTGDLSLYNIDEELLIAYENYMAEKSKINSSNGAAINLRHIRIIANHIEKNKLTPGFTNPFKTFKIPCHKTTKLTLEDEELDFLFFKYKATTKAEEEAITFFKISFFLYGANPADVLRLKAHNVLNNLIIYYRTKTRRTKVENSKPIKVPIAPAIKNIIDEARNSKERNEYLFPILQGCRNENEVRNRIKLFTHRISKTLNKLQIKLGLTKRINLKYARHSFASYARRQGMTLLDLMECLGHSSPLTTLAYLSELQDEDIIKRGNNVFSFFSKEVNNSQLEPTLVQLDFPQDSNLKGKNEKSPLNISCFNKLNQSK